MQWVVALSAAPLQVGVVIVVVITILVQHVRQVIGVGHECLGHQTVNLKRSSLQSHAAVAFAVVGSHAVPCLWVALGVSGAQHRAVVAYIVYSAALLVKFLNRCSHRFTLNMKH